MNMDKVWFKGLSPKNTPFVKRSNLVIRSQTHTLLSEEEL